MAQTAEYVDQNRERMLDELKDFLRIPSISTLPEHAGDVARAAQWTAQKLRDAGVDQATVAAVERAWRLAYDVHRTGRGADSLDNAVARLERVSSDLPLPPKASAIMLLR